jgi:type II secretory ATPase GspE/PulE/Tfp pilus assembly ATPase PilB-like protein
MLGEIRDAATASLAVQAALSGHRLICTLHAATPGGAVARLLEMGVEPYQITSSLAGVLSQRLIRKLRSPDPSGGYGGGYQGRIPVAEFVTIDAAARAAILDRADSDALERLFGQQAGQKSLHAVAADLVARHLTDEPEVNRVLGTIPEGN